MPHLVTCWKTLSVLNPLTVLFTRNLLYEPFIRTLYTKNDPIRLDPAP